MTIFYLTEGLIAADASGFAWEYLSNRFQPLMSGTDFPTLPEGWPEQENTGASKSHIHSSGCGLAFTLSRHLLGVYPAKPGFEECRIAPKLGHLEWAKGSYPSPKGDIQVDWRAGDGAFTMNVDLPANMKTRLCVPSGFSSRDYRCTLDGNPIEPKEEMQLRPGKHTVKCMPLKTGA